MADERDELDEVIDLSNLQIRAKARTIRASERKLAELAREMADRIRPSHDGGPCLRVLSSDLDYWLRRYEEALK